MIEIQSNDFNTMQAQAIRYARELQRRATPQRTPEPPKTTPLPSEEKSFPPPEEIFGHRNPWTQKQETPFCSSACPIKNLLGTGGSKTDGDILLLMALLLVLTSDGGDRMLMMALLYIMT